VQEKYGEFQIYQRYATHCNNNHNQSPEKEFGNHQTAVCHCNQTTPSRQPAPSPDRSIERKAAACRPFNKTCYELANSATYQPAIIGATECDTLPPVPDWQNYVLAIT